MDVNKHVLILGFPDYVKQSENLAMELGYECHIIDAHYFPDGESKLTLPAQLPEHVILCRSLNNPNSKLTELLLTAETARSLGATRLTLVAPYLCYMRQDVAFNPGEAISQHIIGNWLARMFDTVVTVDPHLHRTLSLDAVIPSTRNYALQASALIGRFLTQQLDNSFILGPDEESVQWVNAIAKPLHLDCSVASKTRHSDTVVDIELPDINITGRHVVLVDDIISSGNTLACISRLLRSKGAKSISAVVTHALFDAEAGQCLSHAGIDTVWSTDSVIHDTNAIPLAGLLATAIREKNS